MIIGFESRSSRVGGSEEYKYGVLLGEEIGAGDTAKLVVADASSSKVGSSAVSDSSRVASMFSDTTTSGKTSGSWTG